MARISPMLISLFSLSIFLPGCTDSNPPAGGPPTAAQPGDRAWGPADPFAVESAGHAAPAPAMPQPKAADASGSAKNASGWGPVAKPSTPAPDTNPPAGATPAATPPAPGTAPANAQSASADLTKKGIAGKEMEKGVLATPAAVYMRIPDKVVFLNVQQAMNLYKGEKGALPKTHDDFMRDIIKANNLNLPELPDGSRYVYMPDKEELMIVKDQP